MQAEGDLVVDGVRMFSHQSCQLTNMPSQGDGHKEDHFHGEVGERAGCEGFKGWFSKGREDNVQVLRGSRFP